MMFLLYNAKTIMISQEFRARNGLSQRQQATQTHDKCVSL